MDLRQLRSFVVLATQQHFGRAANQLHIAQPALSRQIRLLEEELGAPLFERHARGATPTQEALLLLERAEFVLRYVEQLRVDMLDQHATPRGPVTMGMSPALAALLSLPITQALRARYPDIRLKIVETFAPTLYTMLLDGAVDLAILSGPVPPIHAKSVPLLTEKICAIGPRDDARLRREQIGIRDLRGIPLILTGVSKSGIRRELEDAAHRANVALDQVVEVESLDVARRLVAGGVGWTVHFASPIKREIDDGILAATPIRGLKLQRSMARSLDRPPSRATEVLMALVQDAAIGLVDGGEWPHCVLAPGVRTRAG
ncbi:LysR family transcriptional regulator [Hydrogenophaga laconesensis]|uniref:LysR family nitrogen assimilation transcriptional regulator n=1 Tax=Hydrogenophaga laconesensis TaxID=1805971 RepID=A0ABU1V6W7_9BURK|nr:LysR family transcriptional regulator [Hydrogenophaga laconesensis]MDR7093175.1 LysR family nitrogen assimilation transcriptional regulator [Hydrogenophaga laconesensis]